MENVIKEVKAGNKILRIMQDTNPDDPRSWDNLAKMIFVGKHKSLGDKHNFEFEGNYNNRQDFIEKGESELRKHFKDVAIIKAVHLYEHSGTSISTSMGYPFDCKWDAGTIGFSVVTKSDIKKDFGVKRVTKALLEQAERILEGEIETLNQYIMGDVYRFEVVTISKCEHDHEHEEHEDSCGGFYGSDFANNGITDHISDERLVEALKAA
jgi:hypothetical protein